MARRNPPDHQGPAATAGLRQRREEQGLPVTPTLKAGWQVQEVGRSEWIAEDFDGTLYEGLLLDTESREIVWTCEHSHFRRDRSALGLTSPVFRSALDCAKDELERRAGEAS